MTLRLVRRLILLCSAVVGVGLSGPALAAATLPEPVRAALAAAAIPEAHVAVWAAPVEGGTPLAHNAAAPMNPASVMKLVTAFATLEHFGPAHTWTTRIGHTGVLHADGRLEGDLILIGAGDPTLTYAQLWQLLRRVRLLGVQHIDGDIVIDGSALKLPAHDPFAFDGRGLRPYNSGPHGMLVHFNTLQLLLHPADETGDAVGVIPAPPLHGIEIDNRLTTSDAPCGTWFNALDARLDTRSARPRLILEGHLPARCGPRPWGASPFPPDLFANAVLPALWGETGGTLAGQVRHAHASANARTDFTLLIEHESRALSEIVREMNKWSSNVIARQLLALLGASASPQADDMVAAGARAATALLEQTGAGGHGAVIENGSGLSRDERLSAAQLGAMLRHVWRQPYMPDFIASLPQVGEDGTAAQRLQHSPARGHAHLKTGTIDNVRAIAGYVLDRHGRRHAVAMLVNDPRAGASTAAQDAWVEWIWNGANH